MLPCCSWKLPEIPVIQKIAFGLESRTIRCLIIYHDGVLFQFIQQHRTCSDLNSVHFASVANKATGISEQSISHWKNAQYPSREMISQLQRFIIKATERTDDITADTDTATRKDIHCHLTIRSHRSIQAAELHPWEHCSRFDTRQTVKNTYQAADCLEFIGLHILGRELNPQPLFKFGNQRHNPKADRSAPRRENSRRVLRQLQAELTSRAERKIENTCLFVIHQRSITKILVQHRHPFSALTAISVPRHLLQHLSDI